MNMKMILLVVGLVLAGCASDPVKGPESTVQTKYPDGRVEVAAKSDYAAYLDKASEQKPLFEMQCPQAGCTLLGIKVFNPTKDTFTAPTTPETTGMVVTKGIFSVLSDAIRIGVPWAAGAAVLNKAFDVANSSTFTNITRDSGNTTLHSTTNTSNTSSATATSNTTNNTTTSTNTSSSQTNTNSNGNGNVNGN